MEKDIIQREIEKSRDARCFFAELALALTIPSVCSRYGLNDKVLKGQNQFLTGKECYAVRCAILHNGDVDLYKQHIMRNEDQNNRYRLLIPDYGDNFRLQYEENDYVHDRPFCAAALAINILNGYKEFKKQNPGFKYPLDRYTPEHE